MKGKSGLSCRLAWPANIFQPRTPRTSLPAKGCIHQTREICYLPHLPVIQSHLASGSIQDGILHISILLRSLAIDSPAKSQQEPRLSKQARQTLVRHQLCRKRLAIIILSMYTKTLQHLLTLIRNSVSYIILLEPLEPW